MERVFLYGPPGSGKTTVGRQLARSLHIPFIDLDERIAADAGCTIPDIFEAEGEGGFRRRETAALQDVINFPAAVIALGGGALLNPHNRQVVEAGGRLLRLDAPFETLVGRLNADSDQRPLLEGDMLEALRMLLDERQAHYTSFPLRLDSAQAGPEALAWQIQVQLGMFHVAGMGSGYDVRVVPGGLAQLGEMLRRGKLNGPLALVTDEQVAGYYLAAAQEALEAAGYAIHPVIIPAGERHKTLATVERLWQAFLEAGLERGSTVVALGGGVVGDLAGFAAATYLRGVAWVAAPTTLLAMVDASLGGKTGADLPQGKNLIGAFHSPRFVLADPQFIATLPEVEQRNGLAEALKHGVISDSRLFDLCNQGFAAAQAHWEEIVRRGMAAKIRVIQEDPYERGARAALNLGHTLGHALELASDYRLRHGEAVGIGMLAAARQAEVLGLAQAGLGGAIAAALHGLGLPTAIPAGLDRRRILDAMRIDKKRAAGAVRFVLPRRVGEVRWGIEVDDLDAVIDCVM